MAISSGARVRLLYVEEVTRGTTPGGPTMKVLRATGRVINQRKSLIESAEVYSDRMVRHVRHGMQSFEGSVPFELACEDYDDFLEYALGGTWTNVAISGSPDLQAIAASTKFVRATGSFVTDDIRPGDIVTTSGFTNSENNGQFRVTSVTATDMVVSAVDGTASGVVDEASAAARNIALTGSRLDVGSTLYTVSMEREFPDLATPLYEHGAGVCVNGLNLNIQPEQMVTGQFDLLGMVYGGFGAQLDATPTEPADNPPLVSFDARSFWEGGAGYSAITGLSFQLNNGRRLVPVVAQQNAYDIAEGTSRITGTLSSLFEDATLLAKFTNETESTLSTYLDDIADSTKFYAINFYRIKYTGGDIEPPAEQETPVSLPFMALRSSTYGTTMSIQRNTAA